MLVGEMAFTREVFPSFEHEHQETTSPANDETPSASFATTIGV